MDPEVLNKSISEVTWMDRMPKVFASCFLDPANLKEGEGRLKLSPYQALSSLTLDFPTTLVDGGRGWSLFYLFIFKIVFVALNAKEEKHIPVRGNIMRPRPGIDKRQMKITVFGRRKVTGRN